MDNIRREDIYRSTNTISFPHEEQLILSYWTEEKIFENGQSLSSGNKTYTFYDGPPFATGLPHYGHILAGTIKDIITRYKYQQGFHVERCFGWDCHGLPVEYEIDKKLGIKDRKQVVGMGIAAYNQECRQIVMQYSSEWRTVIRRMGRWIDFDNDYKTMYPWYMESIWWVFKQLFEKGLVYRGVKVMPFSTHCGTPLSNFEAGENYKLVQDPSVIVKFDIVDEDNTKILAWTTTPWTLPGNLALCVHPNYSYVKVKSLKDGSSYIICESRFDATFKGTEELEIIARFSGIQLVGKKYKPIFSYFEDYGRKMDCFRVVCDDYVSMEHGTGVVHQAPYFGEDDYRVCLRNGIITKASEIICPVDDSGRFTEEVTHFAGQYIKDADKSIIRWLEENDGLFNLTQVNHNYPFCWRSDTPLIYKAVPSWFIRVEHMSDELLKCTDETYWVPEFVKTNRFGNWLKNAQDWSVSRNRFWGTPMPIWTNGKETLCIGSIHELETLSGCTINDLHRDSIDHIKIQSSVEGSPPLKRIDEVFDCWFESGSMPFAHKHYPFENKEDFAKHFPADFIAEGIDQTRGWFYTLMVISTALFGKPPFRNLIANGLVLAPDGQKMSKKKKNYPDPLDVVNKYGADSLRLFLINSPVVRGESLRFRQDGVGDILKDVLLPLFNAYRFLVQNIHRFELDSGAKYFYDRAKYHQKGIQRSLVDDWIISCKEALLNFIANEMELYRLYTVVPRLIKFLDQLTNWYIRLNRRRIKGEMGTFESINSINVLYDVLSDIVKVMAPFTPFFSEYLYQRLTLFETKPKLKSVHYERMPICDITLLNTNIENTVSLMQRVVELARIIRDRCCLPLRHPLKEIIVVHENATCLDQIHSLEEIILSELNIKILTLSSNIDEFGIKMTAKPNYKLLGSRLKSKLKGVASEIENASSHDIQKWVRSECFDILGESISQSDILISYEKSSSTTNMEIEHENDILVLINTEQGNELRTEGLARDIINRMQTLKKKANLLPTDLVSIYYHFHHSSNDSKLRKVVEGFRPLIASAIKSRFIELDNFSDLHDSALIEDNILLEDEKIFIAVKHEVMAGSNSDTRTVRVLLNNDIEPRYGAKRAGTVCLTHPSGEPITFSQLRTEVETLFGLYGVHFKIKCCNKDVRSMEDLTFHEIYVCRNI